MSQETCSKIDVADDQPFPKFKLVLPSNCQPEIHVEPKDVDNDDAESQETYFSEVESKNDESGSLVPAHCNSEINDLVSQITVKYPHIFNAIDEFSKNKDDCSVVKENLFQNSINGVVVNDNMENVYDCCYRDVSNINSEDEIFVHDELEINDVIDVIEVLKNNIGQCPKESNTVGINKCLSENMLVSSNSTEDTSCYNGTYFEETKVENHAKRNLQFENEYHRSDMGITYVRQLDSYNEYENTYTDHESCSTDETQTIESSQIVKLKLRKVAPDSEEWGIREFILTDDMHMLKIRDEESDVECTQNKNGILSEYFDSDALNNPDEMLASNTACFYMDNCMESSTNSVVEQKNLSQVTSQQMYRRKFKSKGKKLFEDKQEWKKYLRKIGGKKKIEKVVEISPRKLRSDRRRTGSVFCCENVGYPDKKQEFRNVTSKRGRPKKIIKFQNKFCKPEESCVEKSGMSSNKQLVSSVQKKRVSSTKKLQVNAYKQLFDIRTEVSDWLRGFVPAKYKSEVRQLIKDVKNYSKELLEYPYKYRLTDQKRNEVKQVTETLVYQLTTVLKCGKEKLCSGDDDMWCDGITLLVPDSEEENYTTSSDRNMRYIKQSYPATEEDDEMMTLNDTENVAGNIADACVTEEINIISPIIHSESCDRKSLTQFSGQKRYRKKFMRNNTKGCKKVEKVLLPLSAQDSLIKVLKRSENIKSSLRKGTCSPSVLTSQNESASLFSVKDRNEQRNIQKTKDKNNEIELITKKNSLISFPEHAKNIHSYKKMTCNTSTDVYNKSATNFLVLDNDQQMELQETFTKSNKTKLISKEMFIPKTQQNSVTKQTNTQPSHRITCNRLRKFSDESETQFSVVDSDQQTELQQTTNKNKKTESILKESSIPITGKKSVTKLTINKVPSQQITSNTLTELNDESVTQFSKVDSSISNKIAEGKIAKSNCDISVDKPDDQIIYPGRESTECRDNANGFEVTNELDFTVQKDLLLTKQADNCSTSKIQKNMSENAFYKVGENSLADVKSELCSQSLLQNYTQEKPTQLPKIKEIKKSTKHKSQSKANNLCLDTGEKSPKIQKTHDEKIISQSNSPFKVNKKVRRTKSVNQISNSQPIKEKKGNLGNSLCNFKSLSQPVVGKKSVTFTFQKNKKASELDILLNETERSEKPTSQNPLLNLKYIVIHPTSDLIPYSEFRNGFF